MAKAAACYERALKDPAIKDSIEAQLVILRHVMDCYDQMVDADKLTMTDGFGTMTYHIDNIDKKSMALTYSESGEEDGQTYTTTIVMKMKRV